MGRLTIAVVVLWMVLFFFDTVWAQKTDIVVLKNGDRITGEVIVVKFGKLKYSTDDVGTIFIEWDKVIFLKSKSHYEVEAEAGDKYFGTVARERSVKLFPQQRPDRRGVLVASCRGFGISA